MSRRVLFLAVIVLVPVTAAWWTYSAVSARFMEPTYRSDRLFRPHGDDVYHLAQKIERGEGITSAEVLAVKDGVNARYGEDITLLFHALGSRNLGAIDTLLGAGSDPYMIDTPSTVSERTFVYYLTLPGHPSDPKAGLPFINQLIELYLKHGGDPNRRLGGADKDPVIAGVALIDNYDGMDLLLKAGADPWAENESGNTAMSLLALDGLSHAALDRFIDQGHLDEVPLAKLREFMSALSLHSQRGDERSLANQAIGRRVLKRNPDYPADEHTERLFQGTIPWEEIDDEA